MSTRQLKLHGLLLLLQLHLLIGDRRFGLCRLWQSCLPHRLVRHVCRVGQLLLLQWVSRLDDLADIGVPATRLRGIVRRLLHLLLLLLLR